MISGLIIGLLAGAALGVVVGLLVRSGQVAAARTAGARLEDAIGANRQLAGEVTGLQQQLVTSRSETVRLTTELDHQRRAADERAASFDEARQQLTGEFARLSTAA
ncbi:MAG: hypothetical protein ACRDWB_12670, partial [Acidimicrobiales bacterium]